MTLKIGSRPGILPSGNGRGKIGLDGLKGRKAVIYFYPKDDTQRLHPGGAGFPSPQGAISPPPIPRSSAFRPTAWRATTSSAPSYGLDFPLASDEDRTMLEAFGVWVEKSMYGKKYMGIERTTVLIDRNGRIARIWPKVKVPGHVDEVLAAARAPLSDSPRAVHPDGCLRRCPRPAAPPPNTRWASEASMNRSRSPSSTSPGLVVCDAGAQILHQLIGLQHVGADLVAPADIGLGGVPRRSPPPRASSAPPRRAGRAACSRRSRGSCAASAPAGRRRRCRSGCG